MATTIITKFGSGAPAASDVVRGELAVDTENKRLYTEDSGGSVVELGTNPTSLTIDNITIDGTEIDLSSGDLTIDVAGDIILDADGGDIKFKDAGTEIGSISLSGSNVSIVSAVSDEDIFFKGNDGGSPIDALFLDMSEAGAATFNAGADFGGTVTADGLTVDGAATISVSDNSDNLSLISTDADDNSGPNLRMYRNSASPDDADVIGQIDFEGRNDNSQDVRYGFISAKISDASDGSEDGQLRFFTIAGGTETQTLTMESGNVGVGIQTPGVRLHVEGATDSNVMIVNNIGTAPNYIFDVRDDGVSKLRVDPSGNLLVGKTSTSQTVEGIVLQGADGRINASADQNVAGIFNRLTDHGDIFLFRKDGSDVGSIGTGGPSLTRLQIGTGDTNLFFQPDANYIGPSNGTAVRDAAIDLGFSAARWKDLYLAGGAYIGGTAAANKLDSYEEGTWIPTVSSGTVTTGTSKYTKVGRLVTCYTQLSNFSDTTSTTTVTIGGLPEVAEANDRATTLGVLAQHIANIGSITGGYLASTSTLLLYNTSSSGFTNLQHEDLNGSSSIYISFSYFAA